MKSEVTGRRLLPILLGIIVALAGFALLFAAVAFFAPRFVRATGNGRTRYILMLAMAVLVILNAFSRMRRRKARRAQALPGGVGAKPLNLSGGISGPPDRN